VGVYSAAGLCFETFGATAGAGRVGAGDRVWAIGPPGIMWECPPAGGDWASARGTRPEASSTTAKARDMKVRTMALSSWAASVELGRAARGRVQSVCQSRSAWQAMERGG
jgi:hypothetical protein